MRTGFSEQYAGREQAGIAVLLLTVFYFEQFWSYRTRKESKEKEFDYFKALDGVLKSKEAQPSLPPPLRILVKIPLLRSLPARILSFGIRRVRIRD